MKRFLAFAVIVVLVVICSPLAYSACVAVGVSSVTAIVNSGISSQITLNTVGYPAAMNPSGTNEVASSLVIFDDATGTNCFTSNNVITISFNAPITGPGALFPSFGDLAVYDSSGSLLMQPTLTFTPTGIAKLKVFQPGPAGNLTTGATGAAVVIQNLRFNVSFAPINALTASLGVSIGTISPGSVILGQVAQAGPLNVSTSNLDFGSQLLNTSGLSKSITLTNAGLFPVNLQGPISFSNFQWSETDNCGSSLPGNTTCTVNVTFSPAFQGPQTGTMTILDNTLGSPHTINLTGTGVLSPGVPVLSTISPDHVISGGPSLVLTATGSNFAPGSTILFNGSPRATTFIDSGTLSAVLLSSDIATGQVASISISNGAQVSSSLTLQVIPNPITSSPFSYSLPHIVQGQGFVTKITISNLSPFANAVTLTYLAQDGTSTPPTSYNLQPFGTVRVQTPESARFGPNSTKWAVVGGQLPLNVNEFLELTDSAGHVLNSIGFNAPAPQTDFTLPVEFTKTASGSFTRTVGLALANPNDTSTTATLQLLDISGRPFTTPYKIQLPAFGQTAVDLSQVSALSGGLPVDDFIGSLTIGSKFPLTAIALGDDVGPFAASPSVTGRATLTADDITAACPLASDITAFNRDLALTFEADPDPTTLVCRAAEGSADLSLMQFRSYQALSVLRNVAFDAPLPWTAGKSLYDWVRNTVQGIRFRGDIATSTCCDPPATLDLAMGSGSIPLQTSGWLGPYLSQANAGLDTVVSSIVQLTRNAQGLRNSCGATGDSTISEMGSWAVAMDIQDFIAGHSGRFFDDTLSGEPIARYRQNASAIAASYIQTGKFCAATNVQPQPAALDFGFFNPVSDMPVVRSAVVSTGTGTPFYVGLNTPSTITGANASDFSIVTNTCDGNLVPPSCTFAIGFTPSTTGDRSAVLNIASPVPVSIPLTGSAIASTLAVPTPFTYLLPHIVTGNGYVTKITLNNLTSVENHVYVRYLTQAGTVVRTDPYTIPAGGTVRISTPESSRFGTTTTQWATVGSTQPLLANLFFEVENSKGTVINTVGFNAAPPISTFIFPVEFQLNPDGTPGGRTAGLAMANPTGNNVSFGVELVDSNGNSIASFRGSLVPHGQTAIDLSTAAGFGASLPRTPFIGTVRVIANSGLAAIALEGDFGPFSATPVTQF